MVLSAAVPSATVAGALMLTTVAPVPSAMVPVAGAGLKVAPVPPVTPVIAAVKLSSGSPEIPSVSVGTVKTPVS